jgi:hypothetical protein
MPRECTEHLTLGVVHFFAHSKEVVNYRKKAGKREEHESEEEQTAAK